MIDLNIVLDVVQDREPFAEASSRVLSRVVQNQIIGCLPSHVVTTLHYIVGRYSDRQRADDLVDWILQHFEIVPQDAARFREARGMGLRNFEDAALAAAARVADCSAIVTRNLGDFAGSPIPTLSPEEALEASGLTSDPGEA